MRSVSAAEIAGAVAEAAARACCELPADVEQAVRGALAGEREPVARTVLKQILANADCARNRGIPLCQDTGLQVVLIEQGRKVALAGDLAGAVETGIARVTKKAGLRASLVTDPGGQRRNTQNNTPAQLLHEMIDGSELRVTVLPKGGGAENKSRLAMLLPTAGWAGVREFVVETVRAAGGDACPPLVVGVGVGGSFERCAYLAKRALFRQLTDVNPERELRAEEEKILAAVNALGIGPLGFGGKTTALAVQIMAEPCHIASLPVAVNLNCHATRRATVTL